MTNTDEKRHTVSNQIMWLLEIPTPNKHYLDGSQELHVVSTLSVHIDLNNKITWKENFH